MSKPAIISVDDSTPVISQAWIEGRQIGGVDLFNCLSHLPMKVPSLVSLEV